MTPWPPKSDAPRRRRERRATGDIIFALSLCRKAGALVTGFDAVKESVFRGKAQLVLCASDLSEGTRRRVEAFCGEDVPVVHIPRTQAETAPVLRKPAGVFAVLDRELAKLCRKCAGAANQKEESLCQ